MPKAQLAKSFFLTLLDHLGDDNCPCWNPNLGISKKIGNHKVYEVVARPRPAL